MKNLFSVKLGIVTFLLIVFQVSAYSQSLKKILKDAKQSEEDGFYTLALEYYEQAMDKKTLVGGGKKKDEAFEGYLRVLPLAIAGWYKNLDTINDVNVLEEAFEITGNMILDERAAWTANFLKGYGEYFLPNPTDLYYKYLDKITKTKLEKSQLSNNFWDLYNAKIVVEDFIDMQRHLWYVYDETDNTETWFSEDAIEKVNVTPNVMSTHDALLKFMACELFTKKVSESQAAFKKQQYRASFDTARFARDLSQTFGCSDDVTEKLIDDAMLKGGKIVAVVPFQKQDKLGSLSNFIVDSLSRYSDDFSKILSNADFESLLLQNNFKVEEIIDQDILKLTELGRLLGVNYLVLGKVIQADIGQPKEQKASQHVYIIESDDYGKYALEGGTTTLTEVQGTRTSKFKIQVKLVNLKTKQVLLTETVESIIDEYVYYIDCPKNIKQVSNRSFSKVNTTNDNDGVIGALVKTADAYSIPSDVKNWQNKLLDRLNDPDNQGDYSDIESLSYDAYLELADKIFILLLNTLDAQ